MWNYLGLSKNTWQDLDIARFVSARIGEYMENARIVEEGAHCESTFKKGTFTTTS